METMWITKNEHSQAICNFNTIDTMYNEVFPDQRSFANDQHQPNSNLTVDEYCQDLDTLIYSLDDFFMPNANANNAHIQHAKIDSQTPREQHKILANILNAEPQMTALTVKTENAEMINAEWPHVSYNCHTPDSGVGCDSAFSPNTDVDSNCSLSPGMDLESPGSIITSVAGISNESAAFLMSNPQNEGGFEIYHDLIMRHLVQDIKATCIRLNIVQDPKLWTPTDCRAWLTDMSAQYHLTEVPYEKLNVNGTTLCNMSLSQFNQCFPNGGETVHAQLQIWNSANEYCKRQANGQAPRVSINSDQSMMIFMNNQDQYRPAHQSVIQQAPAQYKFVEEDMNGYMPMQFTQYAQQGAQFGQINANSGYSLSALLPSPGSCSDSGTSTDVDQCVDAGSGAPVNPNGNNIHLWQFLRELLDQQDKYSHCVRWIDHSAGIFKIEDSHKLARLWGQRKNRPAMNYDKLSRSLRQYYKKNILKKTTRSQRLVYQFLHPYHMC